MVEQRIPEGIDDGPVAGWLTEHLSDAAPPFLFELITGGRSNLTYSVRDAAGHHYVLRRPPLGHLLATAHDVVREWRIVAALGDTPVPVPPALAVCDDPAINGTPFALTQFVDGVVLDLGEKAAPLDSAGRHELAFHLVDVLADLHAVDIERVGLADLSRHDSYVERQVTRWSKQWAGSKTRDLPIVEEVEARLRRDMPEQVGTSIVHGDYRLGNCISDLANRRIAAVLDWELCTLGDPLADLGHLSVYWHDPERPLPLTNDATASGGFPTSRELLERYAKRSGRDVSRLEYYRAFAAWRLAIIAEGVASRYLARHPDDLAALAGSQSSVARLVEFARDSLDMPKGA
ncbi:MAG TPA: phosphotransferase family protein [Dehalococcoidia bacterium]